MKYKKAHYLQISRGAFKRLEGCKTSTKWLYVILNELEHKYTGAGKQDFFFRSIDDLAIDAGLSRPIVIQGLRELSEIGLIETWQAHWKDKRGRLSERHVTALKILDI
ncbi:MAG: hypothetical protein HZB80_03290 [Deltaproteobacteria bacterium]|nr:hypothetical protein [Deltaproteobacteria bacterium]